MPRQTWNLDMEQQLIDSKAPLVPSFVHRSACSSDCLAHSHDQLTLKVPLQASLGARLFLASQLSRRARHALGVALLCSLSDESLCVAAKKKARCELGAAYIRPRERVLRETYLSASSCETDCLIASFFSAALAPLMPELIDEKYIAVQSVCLKTGVLRCEA